MPCSCTSPHPENLQIVQKEIDFMLKAGYITRSSSEYSSPIHLVPKKETGKFRLVGDYRALNQQTTPDRYPTSSVQNLLHRLTGFQIFSKIDLVKAFHQIPMSPSARKKTAIICPLGLFEFNCMPFGLRNASATFQRFIDQVCQGLSNVMVCVDDVVVFSNSEEEHKLHVLELFESQVKSSQVYFAPTLQAQNTGGKQRKTSRSPKSAAP